MQVGLGVLAEVKCIAWKWTGASMYWFSIVLAGWFVLMEGKSIAACSAYTCSINEGYGMGFVNNMHANSDLWHINIRPNETVLICSDQKSGWILNPGSLEICDSCHLKSASKFAASHIKAISTTSLILGSEVCNQKSKPDHFSLKYFSIYQQLSYMCVILLPSNFKRNVLIYLN